MEALENNIHITFTQKSRYLPNIDVKIKGTTKHN